jgi:hypothetical protein
MSHRNFSTIAKNRLGFGKCNLCTTTFTWFQNGNYATIFLRKGFHKDLSNIFIVETQFYGL